jgi:hypothetical protein
MSNIIDFETERQRMIEGLVPALFDALIADDGNTVLIAGYDERGFCPVGPQPGNMAQAVALNHCHAIILRGMLDMANDQQLVRMCWYDDGKVALIDIAPDGKKIEVQIPRRIRRMRP